MLKAELKYPDGLGGYETIQVPNVIDIDIANESITGFSFWQVEGGTAKIDCFMFPELQAVLEQQPILYFDCEFRIYEGVDGIVGDLFDQNIFLGYLKRGNYEYADDDNISLAESEIILTLCDPLKVMIEYIALNDAIQTESITQNLPPVVNTPYSVMDLTVDTVDRLSGRLPGIGAGTPTPIIVSNQYDPLITNPTSVTELVLFDETNFPLHAVVNAGIFSQTGTHIVKDCFLPLFLIICYSW